MVVLRRIRHHHRHVLLSYQRRLQRLPPRWIVELRVIVGERLRALNVQRREYRALLPEDLPSLLLENG